MSDSDSSDLETFIPFDVSSDEEEEEQGPYKDIIQISVNSSSEDESEEPVPPRSRLVKQKDLKKRAMEDLVKKKTGKYPKEPALPKKKTRPVPKKASEAPKKKRVVAARKPASTQGKRSKNNSAKVYKKRRAIKAGEQPGFDDIEKDESVTSILAIDIGTRNCGMWVGELPSGRTKEWLWVDFFPGYDDTFEHNHDLPQVVQAWFASHPEVTEPPVWCIEDQPQHMNERRSDDKGEKSEANIWVESAIVAIGKLMGKRIIYVNPMHLKRLYSEHFPDYGHDINKANVMRMIRPQLTQEEDRIRYNACLRQKQMHKRYHTGMPAGQKKRYKCEKEGDESPTWDDMADAMCIGKAVGTKICGVDLVAQALRANGINPNSWYEDNLMED